MTMIMGINLSNRLYLAGDTRVSAGEMRIDNILKVLPIYNDHEVSIMLAVAGHVEVATHFYTKIEEALRKKILSSDIRVLSEEIGKFVSDAIVDWTNSGKSYQNCCLLFAGTNKANNKKIDVVRFTKLQEEFHLHAEETRKKIPELKKNFETDEIFQIIEKKMQAGGRSLVGMLEESMIPKTPPYLEEALKNGDSELQGVSDSLIFSVTFKTDSPQVKIEKAEWGEFLAYGGGVKKDYVDNKILGMFELSVDKRNTAHMIETSIITTQILDIAEKHKINTIGGTVMIGLLDEKGSQLTGKDYIPPNQLKLHEQIIPLWPFNKMDAQVIIEPSKAEL